MDTLLTPRKLCQTDSDTDSETDITKNSNVCDNDTGKVSLNRSVMPRRLIICPTARFLQINPKKISSFDLLVHPPKRQRLVTPSSSSSNNNSATCTVSTISEEDDKEFKISNVHFENEIISTTANRPISTASAITNSSIMRDETSLFRRYEKPFNQHQQPQQKHEIVTNMVNATATSSGREIDWQKLTLLYLQKGCETSSKKQLVPVPVPSQSPSLKTQRNNYKDPTLVTEDSVREEDLANDDVKEVPPEFPCTESYVYYVNYSHGFRSVVTPNKLNPSIFQTVNEKDINKNYIANIFSKSKEKGLTQSKNSGTNTPTTYQLLTNGSLPPRKLRRPKYRLKGISSSSNARNAVHLKESSAAAADGGERATLNPPLPPHISNQQNAPPYKRRKVNAPGDFSEESEIFRNGAEMRLIYRICNELTNESKTIAAEHLDSIIPQLSPTTHQEVRPIFTNMRPATRSENVSLVKSTVCQREQTLVHEPPLQLYSGRDFSRRTEANGDGQTARRDEEIDRKWSNKEDRYFDDTNGNLTDDVLSIPVPFHSRPPFTIIVQESPLAVGQTKAGFFLPPFMNFVEKSNIRIEDVTEEFGGAFDNTEETETETILPASDPILSRKDSTSCPVMDFLLDYDYDYEEHFESSSHVNLQQENEDKKIHEVMRKPHPQLTRSSSVHSLNSKDPVKCPTLDRFLEKRRKSDFFVGKLAGLSKSIMKLYKKSVKITKFAMKANGSKDQGGDVISTTTTSDSFKTIKTCKSNSSLNRTNHQIALKKAGIGIDTCDYAKLSKQKQSNSEHLFPSMEPDSGNARNTDSLAGDAFTDTNTRLLFTNAQNNNTKVTSQMNIALLDVVEAGDPASCQDSERFSATLTSSAKTNLSSVVGLGSEVDSMQPISRPGFLKRIVKLFSRTNGGSKKKVRIKNESDAVLSQQESPFCPIHNNKETNRESDHQSFSMPQKRPTRTLIEHTDSKELYRERRRKLFQELKEFQEDSLKAYIQVALEGKKEQNGKRMDFMKNMSPELSPCKFIRKQHGESCIEADTGASPFSERRAVSTSYLPITTTNNNSQQNRMLRLPSPPVIELIMEHSRAPAPTNSNNNNNNEALASNSSVTFSGIRINQSCKTSDNNPISKAVSKVSTSNSNLDPVKSCKTMKGILKR